VRFVLSITVVILLCCLPVDPALGQAEPESQPANEAAEGKESADQPRSVTHHTVEIGGRAIDYTATAGMMPLKDEDGTEKANVFFIAYTRDGVEDVDRRPLTFSFNGGPGSSSVWLHLGAFGPRRVEMGDAGSLQGPPWQLVDNGMSILDVTDLVFVDPVTTGYSRAVPGEDDGQFHGVQEDVESVGEFIRLYTTTFERWNSPKFLAGESYGTTRAAGLSGYLQNRHGMFLNGVILVSAILDFQTARFDRGNDLPYMLYLPTCTATAWYHRRLDDELQRDLRRTLDEVESFALGEYAHAMLQGDALPRSDADRIAARLARYTGLSESFVRESNLRIGMRRFTKELLRDQRRTVGRLDSRFLGIDADAAGEGFSYDPSYAAIQGPYTATLNHYVRTELLYENDLTYEILTGRVRPWNYGRIQNRYLNVAETLRSAMTKNQDLQVFVAAGYYDFATPYFAAEYTMSHLGLDPSLQEHVTIRHYEAGHMMYVHLPSLEALKRDLDAFIKQASAE
jgi:carboxypeptidase C (cathepsin A)